jgi:DNA-binding MarR family transcriptional regulator
MNRFALAACLAVHQANASLQLKLDDELGTLHGVSWDDFALLSALADAPQGRLPLPSLMRPTGLRPSAIVRRLAPLEKLGWLAREGGGGMSRVVVLLSGGRRVLHEASDTAAEVCATALAQVAPGGLAQGDLQALAHGRALALR